jgi:hypothetical protein
MAEALYILSPLGFLVETVIITCLLQFLWLVFLKREEYGNPKISDSPRTSHRVRESVFQELETEGAKGKLKKGLTLKEKLKKCTEFQHFLFDLAMREKTEYLTGSSI